MAHYSSNLTKVEWKIIRELLPPRPERTCVRWQWKIILNAIFYVMKTGCQWRQLPSDFPPWKTVYHYWRIWSKNGFWQHLNDSLREAIRLMIGKKANPSASITDSQSVKSAGRSEKSGFDGNKKIKGIKRQILVDTNGFLIVAKVLAANENDGIIAQDMLHGLDKAHLTGMGVIWADEGYQNSDLEILALGKFDIKLEIIPGVKEKKDSKGFKVQPKRWIVERTFAWLGNYRRLSKDYERLVATSEAAVYACMIRLMLARF
jgi:putative transposase